jgi:hypothetical protein
MSLNDGTTRPGPPPSTLPVAADLLMKEYAILKSDQNMQAATSKITFAIHRSCWA